MKIQFNINTIYGLKPMQGVALNIGERKAVLHLYYGECGKEYGLFVLSDYATGRKMHVWKPGEKQLSEVKKKVEKQLVEHAYSVAQHPAVNF